MLSYVFMKILEGRPRSYDRLMNRFSRGRVKEAKHALAELVPWGARVLEMGCGTGELAEILVNRGAIVEGFDISASMIAEAHARIERHGLGTSFIPRQMGVEAMDDLPSESFDIVISTLVLSELNPNERWFALKHAARVLRPGGKIIIADEVVPRHRLNRLIHAAARAPALALTYLVANVASRPVEDIAGDLAAVGFKVEREERNHGDAFALVVARTPAKGDRK